MQKKLFVISLGGSLIVPDKIDTGFLLKFRRLLVTRIKKDERFIIVCGGGRTARNYQQAVKAVVRLSAEDVDWLGIHGTRINAQLLRSIFADVAHPKIVKPIEAVKFKEKILIGGGWKPGRSTDYCAVKLAEEYGADKILNLSDIDYVYDQDPRNDRSAKPIARISWPAFRKLLPAKWSPGLSSPFDPVASRLAQKLKLEVAIINGRDFKSINDYLSGKKFKGTTIF